MLQSVAVSGIFLLVITLFFPGVEPVLSNYIPVLHHPLFFLGLGLFTIAVLVSFFDTRLLQTDAVRSTDAFSFPPQAFFGIRAAIAAFFIATISFAFSWYLLDKDLLPELYFELLFWGGGHVLQFANILAMLVVWIFLVRAVSGKLFITPKWAGILFTLFILPLVAAPYFAAQIENRDAYLHNFTSLMQWGIFPIVLIFMMLAIKTMVTATDQNQDTKGNKSAHYGFWASVLLTITGFILGAFIQGPDTMVPAHYHAAIGGVTVAFMAMSYELFSVYSLEIPTAQLKRLSVWQPVLYGTGQFLLAGGLAYARMLRKVYGEEQIIHSFSQKLGLGIMGIGGLLAVSGGVLFVWIALRTWFSGKKIYVSDAKIA